VHRGADVADGVLEDAVGARVGDHERRQPVAVLGDLGVQVVDVDVTGRAVATTTTRMPAMTALAALVPCALAGMRQTSRSCSPLASW
jgi:hypothetical protein